MNVNKKNWLIDISIIVLIIVMGVFVVNELSRTFILMRQQTGLSQNNPADLIPETDGASSAAEVITEKTESVEDVEADLFTLDGESVDLSDFEGTPMLVNFWATWCPPCLEEMPLIQEYADRFENDLVVLAINAGEDEAIVRDFITRHQFSLTFLLNPTNSAAREYRVYGFPTTLFFDEEGNLVSTHIGELNEGLLDRNLLKIGIGE